MPEYLAPGVYVEEVDTGSKPIEGVSTSTTGMIGVTERGPVDIPILVTSYGEFVRWFGDKLRRDAFSNGNNDPHCYLPHAVQGYFENGGKRLYLTRILDKAGATAASFDLHNGGSNTSAQTMLLRSAAELTGTAATPIYVLNVNQAIPNTGGLAIGDRIRVGSGSDAEYRIVGAAPGAATHVALNFPLSRSHTAAVVVDNIQRVPAAAPNAFALQSATAVGANSILVAGAAGAIAANDLLEIGAQFTAEYRFVTNVVVTGANLLVSLDSPLSLAHANASAVAKLNPTPAAPAPIINALATEAQAGDRVVFLNSPRTGFSNRSELIIFDSATNATREARRIGSLGLLSLSTGAYEVYSSGSLVENITLADDAALADKALTTAAAQGATVISLDNRTGLAVGDVLRLGASPNQEYNTIDALPNPSPGSAAPNRGNVVLSHPLGRAHANSTVVHRQTMPPALLANRPPTVVALDLGAGGLYLSVTDSGAVAGPADQYLSGEFIRVTSTTRKVYYHVLTADAAGLDARPIQLDMPLSQAHSAGSPVAERARLVTVQALDAGSWGNRLRISLEDEETGLVSNTSVLTPLGASTQIKLASNAGVERGTILELIDPSSKAVVGGPLKAQDLNRSTGDITLAGTGLDAAQQAAIAALPPGTSMGVRSREFRLTVQLLRQPDPSTPSRNDTVLDSETFRYLSMDPRHSRYIQTVIGDINGPSRLSDHRPEGESWYIRVHDLAQDLAAATRLTTLESVRLGPEMLVDILPDGRIRPARHRLEGGDDSISTLSDDIYIGIDDPTPENRTGLYSLRNIDQISLIGCPGRTSTKLQTALINHCEFMRYRFAVLDGPQPPQDMLPNVQDLRQRYDTKYASIYHPWLVTPDPFPTNLANIADYPIPPSGHVLGLIARTDIERGVHKAPANEVLRGITGLQRLLNKEQQDILNPYPVNINVIRDFRPNNRGIRVFGARVITSDPDWKYVNVRRLLIFLEASIDRGLQWVVFEPNAESLWARVRRSISAFLTTVWRNGALEGTKREEAYFVKCDRTTMTQADIDNGRLIVVIGVAPVKPAEFVIIRIGLWTAHGEE